jgi:hypothetical protein
MIFRFRLLSFFNVARFFFLLILKSTLQYKVQLNFESPKKKSKKLLAGRQTETVLTTLIVG